MVKRKAEDHSESEVEHPESVGSDNSRASDTENSEASDNEEENESGGYGQSGNKEATKLAKKRQVTATDVQTAREAGELFKSNIFKLQMDELIREVLIKETHGAVMEKALHRLHQCILQVPESGEMTLAEAEEHFHGKKMVIPFPEPRPTTPKYRFGYLPPEDVNLVGAFGLKAAVARGLSVDVVVTMPASLFVAKDYLNYRAFYKRSFYVAWLAEGLLATTRRNGLPVRIQYAYKNDDALCPMLKITSIRTDNATDMSFDRTHVDINVIVGFPEFYDARKVAVDRNCVRIQGDDSVGPTPYYNLALVALTQHSHYLRYIYEAKTRCATRNGHGDPFGDACKMGRVWLHQRGYNGGVSGGGFGHFEFSVVMAMLLARGELQYGYSLYQLFKGSVQYLARGESDEFSSGEGKEAREKEKEREKEKRREKERERKRRKKEKQREAEEEEQEGEEHQGREEEQDEEDTTLLHSEADSHNHNGARRVSVSVGSDSAGSSSAGASAFTSAYTVAPTLIDTATELNVYWKIAAPSATALRRLAADTVRWLDDSADRFHAVFLHTLAPAPFAHDLVYTVAVPESAVPPARACLALGSPDAHLRREIHAAVAAALDTRAVAVDVRTPAPAPFALARRAPPRATSLTVTVDVDPTLADRVLTAGPRDTDTAAAAAFRAFWGTRCSLRRFADGAIRHCVVWPDATDVPGQIVAAALAHVHPALVATCGAPLLAARLPLPRGYASGAAAAAAVHSAFDALARAVQAAELPLRVKTVAPALALLRGTAAEITAPFDAAAPDAWNDAVVQLEALARWPDDARALAHTKTAFLLRVGAALAPEYRTWSQRDEDVACEAATVLHVLAPTGHAFRLRVACERDGVVMARAVGNAGAMRAPVQREAWAWRCAFDARVRHTRTVALMARRHPAYGPATRLFKQWLDAHCLMDHVGDEAAELLALVPFVAPAPYSEPGTGARGFLQTVRFLASWNWRDEPVLLDVGTGVEDADWERATRAAFTEVRSRDPRGAAVPMFVATRDDPLGVLWTHGVAVAVAARMTALARGAEAAMRSALDERVVTAVFTPAWRDFDFCLRVRRAAKRNRDQYKNLAGARWPADLESGGGADARRLLAPALARAFGNVVLFLARRYPELFGGENVVAGVFLPQAAAQRRFRVSLGADVEPAGGDDVVLNRKDVLDQIVLLGGDLVESTVGMDNVEGTHKK